MDAKQREPGRTLDKEGHFATIVVGVSRIGFAATANVGSSA